MLYASCVSELVPDERFPLCAERHAFHAKRVGWLIHPGVESGSPKFQIQGINNRFILSRVAKEYTRLAHAISPDTCAPAQCTWRQTRVESTVHARMPRPMAFPRCHDTANAKDVK